MPLLSRKRAAPLLRQVGNKPHASADDHEETAGTQKEEMKGGQVEEEDIYGEPLSSSDEAAAPPPQASQPSRTSNGAQSVKAAKAKSTPEMTTTRRRPQARAPRVPKTGSYLKGRQDKAKRGLADETDKENQCSSPQGGAEESGEGVLNPEMGHRRSKKPKTFTTKNIHATASYAKPTTYSTKASAKAVPSTKTSRRDIKRESVEEEDDSDNCSLASLDYGDLTAAEKNTSMPARTRIKKVEPPPTPPPRPNLLEQLGNYKHDSTTPPASSQPSHAHSSTHLNLNPHSSGPSSPLSSLPSTPQESAETLEKYFADLPPNTRDDQCPLCQAPVSPTHYRSFWTGKALRLGHQTAFCKQHHQRSAAAEYAKQGYPRIDWAALPARIAAKKPQLTAILRDTAPEPSTFRLAHAAAVRSGRELKVRAMLADDSILRSSTGYYGARGFRVMMEVMTGQLRDVLAQCQRDDEVVGRYGFAAFMREVLVPELTLLLVGEDLGGVGVERAREVVGGSGEVGWVVNEEVEDRVEGEGEGSDGE
ncbi:RTC4-like domain-containing protein [Massariosphaeria phaeospora]|uniref:Restriction of telomere capping protein 4 n=1 Tax=Massariosphaeria phaeospora TaxID=100035 RepID=A0A7C8I316_9PLEO|nr:RTC4-like domain-containing protein [Massariosphaeria phaeospora]